MNHQKQYVPIILSDQSLTARHDGYTEEKYDQIRHRIMLPQQSQISKAKSQETSPQNLRQLIRGVKKVVFPSILKQTKDDIKKLRQRQIEIIFRDDLQESAVKPQKEKQRKKPPTLHQKKLSQASSVASLKPIYTELSMIAQNSLPTSVDSEAKFKRISPQKDDSLWQITNQVNRINKAYEIQKEIHHLERFKTLWKPDMISQYLQLKIVLRGLNFKKGLKQVFLLIHLPHQNIVLKSSQTEAKNAPTSIELSAFVYFVPIYEKISSMDELQENVCDWSNYFLDLLHFKQCAKTVKFFFLDGKRLQTLAQIPTYEKFIYVNLEGQFKFWEVLGDALKLPGEFQTEKYHKLATKLLDLKTRDDVQRFFQRRENLLPFFSKLKTETMQSECSINLGSQIEIEHSEIEPNLSMFDQSIHQMNEKEQSSYLKAIQSFINQNKNKYSHKLNNLEENMRLRLKTIKDTRRKSIENKLKSKKKTIKAEEEEHFERRLLHEDEMSIEEIQDDAIEHVHNQKNVIFKKPSKFEKIVVADPFLSLDERDNQKFKDILKLVNVEKIVLEKRISRGDVLHYLSLFKALMDSDKVVKVKEMHYPPLFITIEQLQRGLPYIALHKNKINTKKLNDACSKSYNYVDFMEFLDIFTTEFEVSEKEL